MIRILVAAFLLLATLENQAQNVGIGTRTPHPSAILDVADTGRGLLMPRMTAIQRKAISNPVPGLMVYQTDGNGGYYFYTNGQWQPILKDEKEYIRMRNLYYISNL